MARIVLAADMLQTVSRSFRESLRRTSGSLQTGEHWFWESSRQMQQLMHTTGARACKRFKGDNTVVHHDGETAFQACQRAARDFGGVTGFVGIH